jgi:hypothetical protein
MSTFLLDLDQVGDANSKLFHLPVSARCRKNHIPSLHHADRVCTTHQAIAELLKGFYTEHWGSQASRECTLNWQALRLTDLEKGITGAEIYAAIKDTPAEKSPSPDGYIGAFYKLFWDTIKEDLTAAIREIFDLRARCWNLLNSANVALIPKKEGAQTISDYRPISVMHNVAKLLGKILANRLSPHLDSLVSPSQSALIKGRSIQDNFQYVQEAV